MANAAYWHPISIAGEAVMLDLIINGRLEFGLGSGAYQRELDWMKPELDQKDSWQYSVEMLLLVRDLWHVDVAHDGKCWQFPNATSCPKPLQKTVPMWVAARAPITFDYAVANDCNIMSWPLTQPFSAAEKYRNRLDDAITNHGGTYKGSFAMMRHTSVYGAPTDRQSSLDTIRAVLSQFGNLMMKSGEVRNGFSDPVPLETIEGNFRVEPKNSGRQSDVWVTRSSN